MAAFIDLFSFSVEMWKTRGKWSEENMKLAIEEVRNGKMWKAV